MCSRADLVSPYIYLQASSLAALRPVTFDQSYFVCEIVPSKKRNKTRLGNKTKLYHIGEVTGIHFLFTYTAAFKELILGLNVFSRENWRNLKYHQEAYSGFSCCIKSVHKYENYCSKFCT